MKRAVLKFGGSSVATIEKMQAIANKVITRANEQLVIVVSAMGKTTNNLLAQAKQISKNPTKREIDLLISTGEQVSISFLTMILNELGHDAIALTGFQAGIKTIGLHTKNKIAEIDISKIEKHLSENKIVVVAGFQGFNDEGDITTLGRGGSDTTAVALAAKLKCNCEIYTDVDGIYSVNPEVYPQAQKLDLINYEEMKEMAILGAKVMESRAIEIGHRYQVPIYVASAHKDCVGTWIKKGKLVEEKSVTGLSVSEQVMMVMINHLPSMASIADIFVELADNEINIDMISQTISHDGLLNIAFTASSDDLEAVNSVVAKIKAQYGVEIYKDTDIVKVSIVGMGMRTQSGVAAVVFKLFSENNIAFKLVTTSEISISYIIEKNLSETAVRVLAKEFNL